MEIRGFGVIKRLHELEQNELIQVGGKLALRLHNNSDSVFVGYLDAAQGELSAELLSMNVRCYSFGSEWILESKTSYDTELCSSENIKSNLIMTEDGLRFKFIDKTGLLYYDAEASEYYRYIDGRAMSIDNYSIWADRETYMHPKAEPIFSRASTPTS